MKITEREQEIIDCLTQARKMMSVKDIADTLYISEPTVRRRLSSLAEKGLIVRTHGGALINYNVIMNKNIPLYMRITSMSEEKSNIAKKASSLIKDGNVIFLDASSSSFHLLPYLKSFHDLTVCTNSLRTAMTLTEMNINTICLGGSVNLSNLACNSQETFDTIKNINADILFFSCDALSEDGILTDNSRDSSFLRMQFMRNAKTKVLLIDNSKLNKKCWYTLCDIKDVDYCFCNVPLPDGIKAKN